MHLSILLLQEKQENINNIHESLPDCDITTCDNVERALQILAQARFDLIISAVHLEYDGSVFEFLKAVKSNPTLCRVPFIFYCSRSSLFARSVRHGLQIAARALGAEKYITMERFNREQLRAEVLDVLFCPREKENGLLLPAQLELAAEYDSHL